MNLLRPLLTLVSTPFRWLSRFPRKLIGAPRRLLGLSFSARVSVLLGIALGLLVITAFFCYAVFSERPDWSIVTRWPVLLTIVALLVVIPLIVYQALKLWLEGDTSRYPDIDEAWAAGLDALKKNGVDLQEVPLFLMLGSPDRELSDVLVRSTGREFLVPGRPEGRAPLCWYASREAVFLFTAETGCLSRLSSVPERMPSEVDRPSAAAGTPSITGTLITGAVEQTGHGAGVRGSLPPFSGAAAIRGTLVPGAGAGEQLAAAAQHSGARLLSLREFDEESDRLRYIGTLLRRERQPLCPLNGQMVLVPSPLLTDVLAAQETIEAIRRDLETVREATQVNCPATLLVTGMEHVPGFVELVRRVGIPLAKETRFGKGYNVWSPVDPENMDALSSQACGAFEDWVYTLFREAGGLGEAGE